MQLGRKVFWLSLWQLSWVSLIYFSIYTYITPVEYFMLETQLYIKSHYWLDLSFIEAIYWKGEKKEKRVNLLKTDKYKWFTVLKLTVARRLAKTWLLFTKFNFDSFILFQLNRYLKYQSRNKKRNFFVWFYLWKLTQIQILFQTGFKKRVSKIYGLQIYIHVLFKTNWMLKIHPIFYFLLDI